MPDTNGTTITPLKTSNGTGLDITTLQALTAYTPTNICWVRPQLRLTGMNGAAATVTVHLRNTTDGITLYRESVAKDVATDTGITFLLPPFLTTANKAYALQVVSSNASDTGVAWQCDWLDAGFVAANAIQVGGTVQTPKDLGASVTQTGDSYPLVNNLRRVPLPVRDTGGRAMQGVSQLLATDGPFAAEGWPAAFWTVNGPQILGVESINRTYVVYQTCNGDDNTYSRSITYYDHVTGEWADPVAIGGYANTNDIHSVPSIARSDDGILMVCYEKHDTGDTRVYYKLSTNPDDITAWGDETIVPSSANVEFSYPTVYYHDGGFLIFGKTTAGYVTGVKWYKLTGETWTSQVVILWDRTAQQQYLYTQVQQSPTGNFHIIACADSSGVRINVWHVMSADTVNWTKINGTAAECPITDLNNIDSVFGSAGQDCWTNCGDMAWTDAGELIIAFPCNNNARVIRYNATLDLWTTCYTVAAMGATHVIVSLVKESNRVYRMYLLSTDGSGARFGDLQEWVSYDSIATWQYRRTLDVGTGGMCHAFNPHSDGKVEMGYSGGRHGPLAVYAWGKNLFDASVGEFGSNDRTMLDATAKLDEADAIDGKTLRQAMRIMAAMLAGKVDGAGSGVETFTGLDGSTPRVEVTVDASGNRSAVTYDPAP